MTDLIIHEKVYITEEMRYRERLCLYALKHGVTKAARRYHTNRQFVYRQLQKYDGTVRSLGSKADDLVAINISTHQTNCR